VVTIYNARSTLPALRSGSVRLLVLVLISVWLLAGCSAREVQDSLAGSTAQRLVTHSIDDLVGNLPEQDFLSLTGQRLYISSHFIATDELKDYADQRLVVELARRFNIEVVPRPDIADQILTVFYTSLGTDQGHLGFFLPLGFMPGVEEGTRINLITLEQFHGVAEMYYFLGPGGHEQRGRTLQARTRTDALGLPIITIPISSIDRR
jgi:hypothetical protein